MKSRYLVIFAVLMLLFKFNYGEIVGVNEVVSEENVTIIESATEVVDTGVIVTEVVDIVNNDENLVMVERVVDGDTFVLETGEKVRMILINTPESVHPDKERNTEFGKLASEYAKNLLEGKNVYLEKDVSETDRYGRLLRYVYLEDGTFVNELIVKEGYAQIATYPPDVKYKDIILAAETYARENEKGLWAAD